jgi:hypothetical protein
LKLRIIAVESDGKQIVNHELEFVIRVITVNVITVISHEPHLN